MNKDADRIESLIKQRIGLDFYDQVGGSREIGRRFLPLQLPSTSMGIGQDFQRKDWALVELLAYYDREFVQNAYLVVLKRDADVEGLTTRLRKLQTGEMSRVEVLFRLRYGWEGRQRGARIRGLPRAFLLEKICSIPVLGVIPRYLVALARLPRMQRELEQIRGIIAMHKNESDERDQAIVDFQNNEFQRLSPQPGERDY
jgi:O-antigen chain-terminating methyltransferase